MKLNSLMLIVVGAFLLISCGSEEPKEITFEDIERDFDNIDLTIGTQDVSIEFAIGQSWLFRVVPPKTAISGPVPLIIDLHGASGGSETAHMHTDCYLEPGLEGLNAFIISPNAGDDEWYDESNQEKVFHLVRMAAKYWSIDTDKVAITGYSNGGNGVWFYAESQPSTFSAGIAMASSYDISTAGGSAGRKIDIPLYVIHSNGDALFPIETTHDWVVLSQEAGSEIEFVEVNDLSHNAPCDYIPAFKDAVSWLTDTAWK